MRFSAAEHQINPLQLAINFHLDQVRPWSWMVSLSQLISHRYSIIHEVNLVLDHGQFIGAQLLEWPTVGGCLFEAGCYFYHFLPF